MEVRAESVHLQLPPEDQKRLDELATLRKEEGLWEYQRRYQVNKRHYLRTDVLKDAGSAVVWWLAKHEDNPEQVAANIDLLTQLVHAANNNHMNDTDSPAPDAPAGPPTPAERFDAFLDSLDPAASDDVRLTLTSQVARLVDGHDQKAADEMRDATASQTTPTALVATGVTPARRKARRPGKRQNTCATARHTSSPTPPQAP